MERRVPRLFRDVLPMGTIGCEPGERFPPWRNVLAGNIRDRDELFIKLFTVAADRRYRQKYMALPFSLREGRPDYWR